jgi:iron(III) transport system ATP-binding protein
MFLELSQLDVQYPGNPSPAVRGVNLGLRAGDIGVLIGPSGCGKTTLLRAVAGLEPVTGGKILLSNRVVSEVGHTEPAESRRIGMVFQDYALFPHMDVGRNVGFGLAHLPKKDQRQRVQDVLALVGLGGAENRYPHELSGGPAATRGTGPCPGAQA